jgi:hypothetical protein
MMREASRHPQELLMKDEKGAKIQSRKGRGLSCHTINTLEMFRQALQRRYIKCRVVVSQC